MSTASYQIEGAVDADGRGPSIWDTFSHTPGAIHHGDTGDRACDHYHRVEEDLDLIASLGVVSYRFSLAWPRIQPDGRGPVNRAGVDFYRRLIDGLGARGIEATATIYHWDLPQPLQDAGGWPLRDTAERLGEFAGIVAAALGDGVTRWITVNEPWVAAWLGHANGIHAPGLTDPGAAAAASHHLLLGRYPPDMLGHYPGLSVVRDGDLEAISAPSDFLGINYYAPAVAADPDRVGAAVAAGLVAARRPDPTSDELGVVRLTTPARRGPRWAGRSSPTGCSICSRESPATIRRRRSTSPRTAPRCPTTSIRRGGCATASAPPTSTATCARARAIAAGVDVRGYFCWSLLDNFEWAMGYAARFGLVWVDYPSGARLPKDSFDWYRGVVAANGPVSPPARS